MYRSRTDAAASAIARLVAALLGIAALGAALGGCSDLYWDRRDAIALSAGDAIAANEAAQTIDPWPPHSGNTSVAFNGQKMQSAVERYRRNLVTQPVDPVQLQVANQAPPTAQTGGSQNVAPGGNATSVGSGGAPAASSTTTAANTGQ